MNNELLIQEGWTLWSRYMGDHKTYFKRYTSAIKCNCNNDKDGIQVELNIYDIAGSEKYEIKLCGELADGTWIELHNWSMPLDLADGLKTIPRLIKTWEYINSI